ncbi:glycosyltransferase family 2 protein [Antarctobacter heliothermus]|uniref:Glycosyltransferase, GT2 family n=1 Tax=Antarctobacter heliothermus TaxID=74033 RepID=A0A239H3P4_9RHOB|nr:glycosyltransferase [Antarctobacter heliothermus]SNS75648.1 Glycosyltransferase, GT2 family [Antarctobacter heliothermus]
MTLPVSIVVVSRDRPAALMRCLTGVGQLDYAPFEIIVVACPAGADATAARPDADHIKLIRFDDPNISAARNLGSAAASGKIVAFIDDDAVPEPLWLRHLTDPFGDPQVACTGGYVIGRNGISYQWTSRSVDTTGTAHPLALSGDAPATPAPPQGQAIKTEGTNMAVRRDVLSTIGGFDPAFRFYLDETDLNLRLAAAGHRTALVPLAQVHHGFAQSARRDRDRSPRDLTEIGASQMVFLRKHGPEADRTAAWRTFADGQRARLLRFMQSGPLDPLDVARLMRGLQHGAKDGASRAFGTTLAQPDLDQGFRPYPGRPDAPRVRLSGRPWQAARLRAKAAKAVRDGAIVSLFLFSPTARRHRVTFTSEGVWEQSGGLFGQSHRNGPAIRLQHFSSRLSSEIMRVQKQRG